MPYAQVRGTQLYYEQYGSGPTLVILHGLLSSIAMATPSPSEYAAHGVRVIAYDARGHGRSGYSTRPADYRWSSLARDLSGLLDALGIEQASLYGTSMGAGASLMFAQSQPERVQRLILKAPPPFEQDIGAARFKLGVLGLFYRCFGTSLSARLLAPLPRSAEAYRSRELIGGQRRSAVIPAIRGLLFDPRQLTVGPMSAIQHPTLILAHAGDALHPLRSAELLAERMPNAQLDIAPSASHRNSNPEILTRSIAAFVKNTSGNAKLAAGA